MIESVTTCAAVYPVLGGTGDQCVLDTCGWEDRRLGEADAKACAAMGLITEEMRLGQASPGGVCGIVIVPAADVFTRVNRNAGVKLGRPIDLARKRFGGQPKHGPR